MQKNLCQDLSESKAIVRFLKNFSYVFDQHTYFYLVYVKIFNIHYPWLPRCLAKKCKNSSEECAKVTEPVPVLTKLSLSLATLPEFFSCTIVIFWYPARFIFCPLSSTPHIYTLHHCTVLLWFVTALKLTGIEFKRIKAPNFWPRLWQMYRHGRSLIRTPMRENRKLNSESRIITV